MQATSGQLNAYDITAATPPKPKLCKYPSPAAVLKLANLYQVNAMAINAEFLNWAYLLQARAASNWQRLSPNQLGL